MNWEALTALSTAFTGLVILFTVLVGWHQLRAAANQTQQAHRATQLDGMMRIFEQFDDAKFASARGFVMNDLGRLMNEPDFEEHLAIGAQPPWMPALLTLERMGVYLKMGLLDAEPFFYHFAVPIFMLTQRLQPVIERQRKVTDNPYLWKDTEQLGKDVRAWAVRYMKENPRRRPSTGEFITIDFFDPPTPPK